MSNHVRGLHDLRTIRCGGGSRPKSRGNRFLELHSLEVERNRVRDDQRALRRREEQIQRRLREIQSRIEALLTPPSSSPEDRALVLSEAEGRDGEGPPRRALREMTVRY